MSWTRSGAFPPDGLLKIPAFPCGQALKGFARLLAALAFLVVFVYCVTTAWQVLGQLGSVKLAECKRVLDVVSVRDGVLCLLGYRVGVDLLRAVTHRSVTVPERRN